MVVFIKTKKCYFRDWTTDCRAKFYQLMQEKKKYNFEMKIINNEQF